MKLRARIVIPAVLGATLVSALALPEGPSAPRTVAGATLRPLLLLLSDLRLLGLPDGDDDPAAADAWRRAYLEERAKRVALEERLRALPDLRGLAENPLARKALDEGRPLVIPARVCARDATPLRHGVWIDVGREDGIVAGLPVTVGNTLVGIVVRVWSGRVSQVRLLDDPQMRMRAAALVDAQEGDETPALRTGNLEGLGDGRLAMRFVRGPGLAVDAPVVTTGEDWWVPPFLVAGSLSAVEDRDHDGVPEVLVRPGIRLEGLTAVSVWRRPDPPPAPWGTDR
jgi:cell shape-determining protein MreC